MECSLLHRRVQGRVSSLARDPYRFLLQPFLPKVYVPKPTSPNFLSLLWKMLEIQSGYSHNSQSEGHLVMQSSPHQWALQRL